MAYVRKPIYNFKDTNQTGINKISDQRLILIEDTKELYISENNTGLTGTSTVQDAIDGGNIVKFIKGTANNLPATEVPQSAGHPTAKGRALSSMGIAHDAEWGLSLMTPSLLKGDYTFPDDNEVNHLLVGPFNTDNYTMTIPNNTTVVIL